MRVTNEQLMAEIRKLESRQDRYELQDELNREKLRDEMEKTLEQRMREYVLQVVFNAELKPIKQFMAGVISALAAVAGGIAIWLITRS